MTVNFLTLSSFPIGEISSALLFLKSIQPWVLLKTDMGGFFNDSDDYFQTYSDKRYIKLIITYIASLLSQIKERIK